jgi:predicted RNase H-like nuclease
MTIVVGLDLAWTGRNPSGVCVLEASATDAVVTRLDAPTWTAAEAAAFLLSPGPDVIAAIDAPLIRREGCTAERELARAFGRFHAAPYQASLRFLESRVPPLTAGPELGAMLTAAGFELDPLAITPGARGRFAFETYPHALHVTYFGLQERIKYKKGRLALRRAGLEEYRVLLQGVLHGHVSNADSEVVAPVLRDPLPLKGRALKDVEDRLDALTCALAGLAALRRGIVEIDVFGDAATGYIAIPGCSLTSG